MFRKTFQHILFLTLLTITTINAQIVDSALVVDSTKILSEIDLNEGNIPPVRYENGIKIVGEKTFDITIENKLLTISLRENVYSDKGKADMIVALRELTGNESPTTNDIKQIIYVNSQTRGGNVAYVVFRYGLVYVSPHGKETGGFVKSADKSDVFTHDGEIYASPNGSIVATTPTTLLVITHNDMTSVTYESLFGKGPPLKNPSISGGRNPDEVFIRDETMADASGTVRLELDLKTLKIKVKDDID